MGRRRRIPPFEMKVTSLGKGGTGAGETPDGVPVLVKMAPPGSTIAVMPMGFRKGVYQGRRTAMVQRPASYVAPRCASFGLCGGCALQELDLPAQQTAKEAYALAEIGKHLDLSEVKVHPIRSGSPAYAYRNKVELSFGVRCYLSEEDNAAGLPIDGRFLGFHAPGRFDRVVDASRCELISEEANALLQVVRAFALADDAAPPWDVRAHEGFWRHLLIREGFNTGELLIGFYTASGGEMAPMSALAEALLAVDLGDKTLVGVVWSENDGVADVARGTERRVWGRAVLRERLGEVGFELSPSSFFQTSTAGARVLYDTVAEALGEASGTLFDLYCGIGTIGQYLAERFDCIVGVEERPEAIEDAKANARRNGIANTDYTAARMRDALAALQKGGEHRNFVVDPPRAGLHPKVAKALAKTPGEVLIYVACKPGALGRDGAVLIEGGWRLTALWTVDLFPQTGHIEAVGRFVREV